MSVMFRRLAVTAAALVLSSGLALAQSKITLAVGGGSCLCYLPTMLAQQLGEYEKAGVNVEVVDFKGGSESRRCSATLSITRSDASSVPPHSPVATGC